MFPLHLHKKQLVRGFQTKTTLNSKQSQNFSITKFCLNIQTCLICFKKTFAILGFLSVKCQILLLRFIHKTIFLSHTITIMITIGVDFFRDFLTQLIKWSVYTDSWLTGIFHQSDSTFNKAHLTKATRQRCRFWYGPIPKSKMSCG